jgi:hypothetical protein
MIRSSTRAVRGSWGPPTVSLLAAAGEMFGSLLDRESGYLNVNIVDNQLVSISGGNTVVADVTEDHDLADAVGKNATSEVMEGEFKSSVLGIARHADPDRDEDTFPMGIGILDRQGLNASATAEANDI